MRGSLTFEPVERPTEPAPLLEVEDLRIACWSGQGARIMVEDVSFAIGRGEVLGLAGASGAGKSLIGSALLGLLEHPMRQTGGVIRLEGRVVDWRSKTGRRGIRGARMSAVFQDPMTALNPLMSVGHQVCETLTTHLDLDSREAADLAVHWLDEVGIPQSRQRFHDYPHQFSGGMRQRIVIALALCSQPSMVIADEPTTALDVRTQAHITELLAELAETYGTACLLISHNLALLAQMAPRLLVLDQGRIVETGRTGSILSQPRHVFTKNLVAAVTALDRGLDRPRRQGPKPAALVSAEGREPAAPILELDDVSKSFARAADARWRQWVGQAAGRLLGIETAELEKSSPVRAVDGVSITLEAGRTLALVGESGSGKSTIARLAAGLLQPDQGRVRLSGVDLGEPGQTGASRLPRLRQMVFQDPYSSLNPRWRVRAILAEGLLAGARLSGPEAIDRHVDALLERVGLGATDARRFPHEFSGGQRQRIAIARALAVAPRLLICDEPTASLDVGVQAQILHLLEELQRDHGLAMLFISHDLAVVSQIADEIAVLHQGRICELGPTAAIVSRPQHGYTRALLESVPRLPRGIGRRQPAPHVEAAEGDFVTA